MYWVHLIPFLYIADPTSTLHNVIKDFNVVFLSQNKTLKSVNQNHLRKCDYWLEVSQDGLWILCLFFDNAEATWWTFPWTQVLQVARFNAAAGHPVPTLKPVQMGKVFLQSLWQAAHVKALLQHHLEPINFLPFFQLDITCLAGGLPVSIAVCPGWLSLETKLTICICTSLVISLGYFCNSKKFEGKFESALSKG